jgi:hypothetical protein
MLLRLGWRDRRFWRGWTRRAGGYLSVSKCDLHEQYNGFGALTLADGWKWCGWWLDWNCVFTCCSLASVSDYARQVIILAVGPQRVSSYNAKSIPQYRVGLFATSTGLLLHWNCQVVLDWYCGVKQFGGIGEGAAWHMIAVGSTNSEQLWNC